MKCASFAWLTKIGCRQECWQTRMGRGCKKVNFPGSETCDRDCCFFLPETCCRVCRLYLLVVWIVIPSSSSFRFLS